LGGDPGPNLLFGEGPERPNGVVLAASVVPFIAIVVLAVAQRRWIIGGLSTDIVKGEATRTHAF
jgi:hypothetical protein